MITIRNHLKIHVTLQEKSLKVWNTAQYPDETGENMIEVAVCKSKD